MTLSDQIIDIGHWLLDEGLTYGTSGNISARCPNEKSILITPSARDFRMLTERDLVRIDLTSAKPEGRWSPSSEWRLHLAIYRSRLDVNAVIHHHGTFSTAVAVARKAIPVLVDEAADIGVICTTPYALSGSQELAEATSGGLARGSNAVLLANHGAVTVGRDLGEAMRRALEVERLAKIYIGAELLGGAHALEEADVMRSREFLETYHAASAKDLRLFPNTPRMAGPVGLKDLVRYSLQAGITVAFLIQSLIWHKLHR